MVIDTNGGFRGTIGGGTLEWRLLAEAQRALEVGRAGFETRSIPLGPELGQCCGGRVTVALEVFDADDLNWIRPLAALEARGPVETVARLADRRMARRVVETAGDGAIRFVAATGELFETFGARFRPLCVFGAGHVGRALILQGAQLPFDVTWVDPRPDAFPAAVPRDVTLSADPLAALTAAPTGAFIIVLTHSHALDLEIVDAALRAGRFAYVGLIGSATKRARFERQMRDGGLGADVIARLVCPIGLPSIRSKLPAVIAASTLADLIARDEALAALERPARADTSRKVAG
jgi:xanthine dehydrogenase accessory factor